MRRLASFALAAVIALPVMAGDALKHVEFRAFRHATRDLPLAGWRLSYELWRCNRAASKVIAKRPAAERILRSLDDEAADAMASCSTQVEALAREAPAGDVAALKAAIMQANVQTIRETRNPRPIGPLGR